MLDEIDKKIINRLQKGFPISHSPYDEAAKEIGITGDDLRHRLKHLLDDGTLTRFGPMFDMDKLGGYVVLCAVSVEDIDSAADYLMTLDAIAHNYEREHELNMWFVVATKDKAAYDVTINNIEKKLLTKVYPFPKEKTFYVNLYLPV